MQIQGVKSNLASS